MLTSIWFQKMKATADAIWCLSCLFVVPGVVVATLCTVIPTQERHRSIWRVPTHSVEVAEADTSKLGKLHYRLGLFSRDGKLIHEYPDQQAEPGRDAQRGAIVIEIPEDVPSGEYYLKVYRGEGQDVRDIPLRVGG